MQITQRISIAFHPETDSAIEQMNQVLEIFLRAYTAYLQDDWYDLLPPGMLAINGRPAASTGMSPFFMTHGYKLSPVELQEGQEL